MNLNLSFEEFCSQNNLVQLISPPQNEENMLIKINESQKPLNRICTSNEIYKTFIEFFSRENQYQLINVQEFDKNIQHFNLNVIEGIIETYRQNGLDIMKIINQYAYSIREIELKFILYLVLFFAKDVIQQNSLKCEVRAYRVRYLYNFKSKTNHGRVDLCYSTFKYGSFKVELKSLSPSDYYEYIDQNNNKRVQINQTMHMRLSLKCGSIQTLDQLIKVGLYQAQSYQIANTISMVVILLRSTQQSQLIYSVNPYNLPDVQNLRQPLHTIKQDQGEELLPQITDILNSILIQNRIDHINNLQKSVVVTDEDDKNEQGDELLQYDIQAELSYLQSSLDTIKLREKQENDLKKAHQRQKRLLSSSRQTCNSKQKSKQKTIDQASKLNSKVEQPNSNIKQKRPQNKKGIQKSLQSPAPVTTTQQPKQLLIQNFFPTLKYND